MSVRQSAEEYPEHLNPFHSRKNSFKESIRGLRNTLVRSFRGHDKKRPEIRKRQDTTIPSAGVHPSRHTLAVIPRTQPYESPVLLPRSRFSERVPKEKTSPPQADQTKEQNPFEEGGLPHAETEAKIEVNQPEVITPIPQPEVITPTPTERKRIRRRKKRAPIPPNANGDLTVPSSMNGSKWSLVSTDTEFSSTCPSDYEPDYVPLGIEPGRAEEIFQITEEIQKLTDKTDSSLNLSNSINEAPQETSPVPSSSPNGSVEPKVISSEINEAPQETSPVASPPNGSVDPKVISSEIDEVPQETYLVALPPDTNEISSEIAKDKDEIENNTEIELKTPEATLQINGTEDDDDDNNKTVPNDLDRTDYQIQLRDDLAVTPVDDNPTKINEKIIIDDHNNNTEINALHNSKCDIQMIDDDEGLHYSESQSIVFAYTKDERNEEKFLYRERRSVSLSGSRDELQNVNDSIVGRRIEQFETCSSPTEDPPSSPKVRKSVPTKENMLG